MIKEWFLATTLLSISIYSSNEEAAAEDMQPIMASEEYFDKDSCSDCFCVEDIETIFDIVATAHSFGSEK